MVIVVIVLVCFIVFVVVIALVIWKVMSKLKKEARSKYEIVTYLICFKTLFICLFDLILYLPSTIFQLNRDRSSWVEPSTQLG